MIDILSEIVEEKKEEVKILKRDFTLSRFSDSEFFSQTTLDFESALSKSNAISIIAEVKKASPSKGIIREDFNHRIIADIYMNNGADAISVLTDKQFFKGNISFLNDIAKEKGVPLLRKDFIIDEYQIYEAKANGADAILLIAEILSVSQIAELSNAANEIGLAILLELHNEEEISKIDFSLNKIIGINNRNLSNFETDIRTTEIISNKLPDSIILVSESGINDKDNIDYLKTINTNAVLVGEHFMKANNIGGSLKEMKEFCSYK